MNLAIDWNVDAQLIDGWSTPNLYGLLFVTGLFLGFFVVKKMFKKEGIPEEQLDKLLMYMVFATIVGARLGHVLFYGPYFDGVDANGLNQEGYFSHPLNILKVWEGGLASHGGEVSLVDLVEEEKGFVAVLKFGGGCQGCSAVDLTLKDGVEKTLIP